MKRGRKNNGKMHHAATKLQIASRNVVRQPVQDKAKIEQLIQRLKKDLNGPIGMKFLKTVFYPELFKSRIPYSLNNASTALVTHIEEIDINSGGDGAGMIYFFPKVTNGPCIYQYLPDSNQGVQSFWLYTLVPPPSGVAMGQYAVGSTKFDIKQTVSIISGRPLLQNEIVNAMLLSCGDPAVTGIVLSGTGVGTQTKLVLNHPVDNTSLHPMVLDFGNASSVTPGTALPVSAGSLSLPGTALDVSTENLLFNGGLSQQTALNQNFDTILPDLTWLMNQAAGLLGVSGKPINIANTLFLNQDGTLPANSSYTIGGASGASLISVNNVGSGTIVAGQAGWSGLCPQNYATNYDKCALVGASISLEYVGRFDYESGYISASHIEDLPIDTVNTSDIDQGQFSVKAKPNEGLRMVWQPTQQQDFELYFTSQSDATTLGARIPSQSLYAYEKQLQKPIADITYPISKFCKVQTAAPCIALYWKGMSLRQNSFRLTITRRFNMIPNKASKPIADLNRPDINIDPLLTMQKVFQLTRLAPFGGSTLTDSALYNGVRQNFINAIEFNPNIKFGSLQELNSALTGEIQGDPAADE